MGCAGAATEACVSSPRRAAIHTSLRPRCVLDAEMQDLFFEQYKFERFIEVGPSPTLAGMATRTLKAKYEIRMTPTDHVRQVFGASKDQKEIYYQFEDEPGEQTQNQMRLSKRQTLPPFRWPLRQS